MSRGMPNPLAGYFAAQNTHDIDAMLARFAEDAVVRDEGREHRGTSSIRAWMEETTRRYHPEIEVLDVSATDEKVLVDVSISGTFPGSPVRLRYHFTLKRNQVARLEIG